MKDKVILIQGAMDTEIKYYLSILEKRKDINIAGYEFYQGTINNIEVILSKTEVGEISCATATTIAVTQFKPDIIINQGIAGAHTDKIHIGDIIIGKECKNINTYLMPAKKMGEGSNPFEWNVIDKTRNTKQANQKLVKIISQELKTKSKKNIHVGILGSGDIFSKEVDRIIWLNNTFGNLSEDMESIGCYAVCSKFNIPCIGIRIISNNEITMEEYDRTQAIELQKELVEVLEKL